MQPPRKAETMTPDQLNQHMQRAVQLHQSGQLSEAEALYRQALEAIPRHPDILNLLGAVCSQAGRHLEGIKYLKQALREQPDHPHYLVNLGEAQNRAGKTAEAIKSFKRVLLQQPQLPVAHYNLANLLKTEGDIDGALQHYEQALQGAQRAEYFYNYANTLREIGRMRSALEAYQAAVRLNPQHAEAHNNLGTVLLEWDRFEEAEQHYQESIRLKPDFDSAYNNLLQYYEGNGQLEQARATAAQIRHLLPDNPYLELAEASLFPVIPQNGTEIDQTLAQFAATCERLQGQSFELESLTQYNLASPSIMTYYGRNDRALREAYAQLFVADLQPQELKFSSDRPHLGFVVTKGHEGVFLKCMTGLIQNLPERYRVTLVCSRPNGRAILSEKLPELSYLELEPKLEQALEQLRAARFDLLHYWEVGTDFANYFLPFFKPARKQVTSWGWPVTSGIPTFDAYFSCRHLETPEADAHYTEPLMRLERLPVYYAPPPVPAQAARRADFGLSDGQHLYFCAQNLRKIQPDMDALFAGILAADPKGQVLLIEDKREAVTALLQQRLQQNLPEYLERVRILPRMDATTYLGLVKAADVMLDSTNYTGGANTNYDAFVAGTPVVTLPGQFHRGRYTTAAYLQMGYTDLIADDATDYIHKAVQIATQPEDRARAQAAIQATLPEVIEDRQAVTAFCEAVDALFS